MVMRTILLMTLSAICRAIVVGQSKQPISTSIRSVDFRNFEYGVCDGPNVRLRKGRHRYGDSQHDVATFTSVRYVDFDGDGKQEAFVVIDWSSSGSVGGGVNAYVYAMRGSSPVVIWSRCEGRSGATLVGKTIRFGYPEYIGDDANCCPTFQTMDTYSWRNGRFVRIAKKRKRNGY